MTPEQRGALVELNATPGIGPLALGRIIDRFPPSTLPSLQRSELLGIRGVGPRAASEFKRLRSRDFGARELDRAERHDCRVLTLWDDCYPSALSRIPDPPPILYVRGELPAPSPPHLAIVGSRQASGYGRSVANKLAWVLGALGVTITSGLAYGIDAAAHWGAVHGGGRTVAVFGCGIDRIYPSANARLAESILSSGGAWLTEFPIGLPPRPGHFPRRNRLIAGLSAGTLVVECTMRSGSLITARQALEMNREVLAVPGPITSPGSRGPHSLIQEGAKLVSHADDVLDALPQLVSHPDPSAPINHTLMACLDGSPRTIAEIVRRSGLPAPRAIAALAMLSMTGQVLEHSGRRYTVRIAR